MKAIDPNKEYTYTPDYAPEVTAVFVQPHGPTESMHPSKLPAEYLRKFLKRVDGLEIPEELKGKPLHEILPVKLANDIFLQISRAGKLTEDEERD